MPEKTRLIHEAREKRMLITDSEGYTRKMQIGGKRIEMYHFHRNTSKYSRWRGNYRFDEGGFRMLICEKQNIINLTERPNGHLLVLGKSGTGKTYFLCRKIENEIENGKRILIWIIRQALRIWNLQKASSG